MSEPSSTNCTENRRLYHGILMYTLGPFSRKRSCIIILQRKEIGIRINKQSRHTCNAPSVQLTKHPNLTYFNVKTTTTTTTTKTSSPHPFSCVLKKKKSKYIISWDYPSYLRGIAICNIKNLAYKRFYWTWFAIKGKVRILDT